MEMKLDRNRDETEELKREQEQCNWIILIVFTRMVKLQVHLNWKINYISNGLHNFLYDYIELQVFPGEINHADFYEFK